VPTARGEDKEWDDVMWRELTEKFSVNGGRDRTEYSRDFSRILADLAAYELWQAKAGRSAAVRPQLRRGGSGGRCFGSYVLETVGKNVVCLFDSNVCLNTGGPNTPVDRMLEQMLRDARPRLVLSIGFGGGVTADDRVGDIVVTSRALYRLRGDLESFARNGRSYGGCWQPEPEWFGRMTFKPLAEPTLAAPTPGYNVTRVTPPEKVRPLIAIDPRPVITAPLLTSTGFDVGAPTGEDFLGRVGCATEMDGAPVAVAADAAGIDCGFVVGIVVPLLQRYKHDFEQGFLLGWRDYFVATYAAAAARNVVEVVHRICGVA